MAGKPKQPTEVLGPGGIPTRRVAPVPANRNFSEDQGLIRGRGRKRLRNVLNRMEEIQGPLAVLRRCQQENIRVKVYTRNHSEIRGLVTGYVIAFDKHWNLALRDVDEVFQKKIRCKTPALGDVSDFVCIGDLTIRGREISSASEPEEYESEMAGGGPSWWDPKEKKEGVPSTSQASSSSSSSSRGHGRGTGIAAPRGRAHATDDRQRQGQGAIAKKKLELKGAYSVESLDQRARASRLVSREHPSTSEARDAHRLDLSQRDRFEQKPPEGGGEEGEGGKKKRIRKRKKREIRTRHVNQLFIRGENVVLINVLEE
ncbi:U7 snRNA-associated Sm-like protein LSm11 isoform X2 [Macrobrachium nipponense]|uniref:U7 snRNA-associated Sm-like protein LSm11 isoform X2 n=1 Tax=Macrobrachium nipponense TaxID=159736 RepID=UPI0030C7F3F2